MNKNTTDRTGELLIISLLFSLLSPVEASEVEAEAISNQSTAECKVAEEILLAMMAQSEHVRVEPAAHELLGDVYAAEGLTLQASCEYAIARSLNCRYGTEANNAADELANLLAAVRPRPGQNIRCIRCNNKLKQ